MQREMEGKFWKVYFFAINFTSTELSLTNYLLNSIFNEINIRLTANIFFSISG